MNDKFGYSSNTLNKTIWQSMELWTLGAPWDSNEWLVSTHPTPVSGHTLQTKWGNKQSLTLKYKHKVAWLADMNPKAKLWRLVDIHLYPEIMNEDKNPWVVDGPTQ